MKTLLVMVIVIATTRPALAADLLRSRTGETPRATDLLRAEKMAEEAQRRLALPKRKTARWLRGGTGWNERASKATTDADPVVINVRPPRPKTRRR